MRHAPVLARSEVRANFQIGFAGFGKTMDDAADAASNAVQEQRKKRPPKKVRQQFGYLSSSSVSNNSDSDSDGDLSTESEEFFSDITSSLPGEGTTQDFSSPGPATQASLPQRSGSGPTDTLAGETTTSRFLKLSRAPTFRKHRKEEKEKTMKSILEDSTNSMIDDCSVPKKKSRKDNKQDSANKRKPAKKSPAAKTKAKKTSPMKKKTAPKRTSSSKEQKKQIGKQERDSIDLLFLDDSDDDIPSLPTTSEQQRTNPPKPGSDPCTSISTKPFTTATTDTVSRRVTMSPTAPERTATNATVRQPVQKPIEMSMDVTTEKEVRAPISEGNRSVPTQQPKESMSSILPTTMATAELANPTAMKLVTKSEVEKQPSSSNQQSTSTRATSIEAASKKQSKSSATRAKADFSTRGESANPPVISQHATEKCKVVASSRSPVASVKTPTTFENAPVAAAQRKRKTDIDGSNKPTSSSVKSTPANKKRKKMTFQDQVFQHMMLAYKPFSLKSLANELKSTENALHHLMLSLVDKCLVIKKEFTKTKSGSCKTLYWVNYDAKNRPELRDALATPEELQATRTEYETLMAASSNVDAQLAEAVKEPSNADLEMQVQQNVGDLEALRQRIQDIKDRITQQQRAKQKQERLLHRHAAPKETCPRRIKIRINRMRAEWKQRRDKCRDFIEQLADGMEKKPKEVIKLLDLETDENVGVELPPKQNEDG